MADRRSVAGIRPAVPAQPGTAARGIMLPGMLLGLGLGGFVDGILLHQVLQWHHLRTGDGIGGERSATTVAGLEANTLADGLFHVGTLCLTIVGLFILRDRIVADGRLHSRLELAGWLLVGWGTFDLVEGLIDHELLGIHHVRDDLGGPIAWDLGFLAFGAALVVVGGLTVRAARARARGGGLRGVA